MHKASTHSTRTWSLWYSGYHCVLAKLYIMQYRAHSDVARSCRPGSCCMLEWAEFRDCLQFIARYDKVL